MELPHTLHGRLYLLTFDRDRRRFDAERLSFLGYALRTAMLTDLFLTGHLADISGTAKPTSAAPPADPLLRELLCEIGAIKTKTWTWLAAAESQSTPGPVRDQLESAGWIRRCRRRSLGVIPVTRRGVDDEAAVERLADEVARVLRYPAPERRTNPRTLALAQIAFLGELPDALMGRDETPLRWESAIAPILGLQAAIDIAVNVAHSGSSGYSGGSGVGSCGGGSVGCAGSSSCGGGGGGCGGGGGG